MSNSALYLYKIHIYWISYSFQTRSHTKMLFKTLGWQIATIWLFSFTAKQAIPHICMLCIKIYRERTQNRDSETSFSTTTSTPERMMFSFTTENIFSLPFSPHGDITRFAEVAETSSFVHSWRPSWWRNLQCLCRMFVYMNWMVFLLEESSQFAKGLAARHFGIYRILDDVR